METPDPHTKRDRGFTLIELLVVIVILGVLAAIVVFSVNGITDRGEESACQANVETINIASEAYRAQTTGYATTLPALQSAGFLKTIPGTVAGDGLSFSVPEGGYTVAYDPASGLASAGCAAAGSGGATTTTVGGGGGGGGGGGTTTTSTTSTTTTAVPCTVSGFSPTSLDVNDQQGGGNTNGTVPSNTLFTVTLSGSCAGVTSATAYVDRNDDNSLNGDSFSLAVVSNTSNRTWRAALPTSGWHEDNRTLDVQVTFAGAGAPATYNSSMTVF
jgi:prepilin-type N-terminal cleavage/methylation domain-containing protein